MFDLMALAFQADITRIITFSMDREASMRTYTNLGIAEAFHPLSHHGNNPDKQAKLVQIQRYHTEVFAKFVERLSKAQEAGGSVLDHSTILYGSNMSNSDKHNNDPLPAALLGHAQASRAGNLSSAGFALADSQVMLFDRTTSRREAATAAARSRDLTWALRSARGWSNWPRWGLRRPFYVPWLAVGFRRGSDCRRSRRSTRRERRPHPRCAAGWRANPNAPVRWDHAHRGPRPTTMSSWCALSGRRQRRRANHFGVGATEAITGSAVAVIDVPEGRSQQRNPEGDTADGGRPHRSRRSRPCAGAISTRRIRGSLRDVGPRKASRW
jgi:hypothetical protein